MTGGINLVAARRCNPGAEPGREKIFSGSEHERSWLLRLSRNCLKSGGGGRAATTSHLCKEGCLLFTPGSFHSYGGTHIYFASFTLEHISTIVIFTDHLMR